MSVQRQVFNQSFFIPKSKFSPEDIPDLTGKVIIVTGGNTGIGKETIRALLKKNAKVYMAARNKQKAEAAIADLKRDTGKEAVFLELDLANLKAIKRSAEVFLSQERELHVLFNSGGVMVPDIKDVTADGYDLQFGTNVLGHFYFTKCLLATLLETAKSSPPGTVRVVTTSSSASILYSGKNIDYTTMRDFAARKKMGTNVLYYQSKFGNVVVTNELARRYGDQGIVFTSVNPGNIQSDLQRNMPSIVARLLKLIMLFPTPYGALTQLYAGTSPEAKDLNGKYLIPWARVGPSNKVAQDPKVGEELWNWLEKQVESV